MFRSLLRCKHVLRQLKKKHSADSPKYSVNKQKDVQSEGFHRNRQSFQQVQNKKVSNCMKTVTVCLQMLTYRRQLTLQRISKNTQLCVLKYRVNMRNYVQSEGFHRYRQSLQKDCDIYSYICITYVCRMYANDWTRTISGVWSCFKKITIFQSNV